MITISKILQKYKDTYKNVSFQKIENDVKTGFPYELTEEKLIDLYEYMASMTAQYALHHPDYSMLAGNLMTEQIHKIVLHEKSFSKRQLLHAFYTNKKGEIKQQYSDLYIAMLRKYGHIFDAHIKYEKDFVFDYSAIDTFKSTYCSISNVSGAIYETPQDIFMRVSIAILGEDADNETDAKIAEILDMYNDLSDLKYTHATPTLFNAGRRNGSYASCFLLSLGEDSIRSQYELLRDVALISQNVGGIGMAISNIRSEGSIIESSGRKSDGIYPYLKQINATGEYVNQGGKRPQRPAMYIEPHHADIFQMLEAVKADSPLELKNLMLGHWISDTFMRAISNNEDWYLMSPSECPYLDEVYGDEYDALYKKYVSEGKYRKKVSAVSLFEKICETQTQSGKGYILYKDAANRKSNQKNLGTIKNSNLCTEIIEYTSNEEQAVCNLASFALPKYLIDGKFDFDVFGADVRKIVRNLNNVIDRTYYPTEQTKYSNERHRPIGIGVQGLANLYAMLDLAFDDIEAFKLRREIFACLYYNALLQSNELAKRDGKYETFDGSPMSRGEFQFDMWKEDIEKWKTIDGFIDTDFKISDRFDWDTLRKSIMEHGLRNSLLLAPMPTVSTCVLLMNNDSFEPFFGNVFVKMKEKTAYQFINKHLVSDMEKLGIWNENIGKQIAASQGSVQNISAIPQNLKRKYRTAFEYSQKVIIQQAAESAVYICQSMSMNLFMKAKNISIYKIMNMHLFSWRAGLKTGMYYLRQLKEHDAIQYGLTDVKDTQTEPMAAESKYENAAGAASESETYGAVCTMEEGCVVCTA